MTHEVLYEFSTVSFGGMEAIFGHLLLVVVFLDDILLFSKTAEENMELLKQALCLLKDNKLYAKPVTHVMQKSRN